MLLSCFQWINYSFKWIKNALNDFVMFLFIYDKWTKKNYGKKDLVTKKCDTIMVISMVVVLLMKQGKNNSVRYNVAAI